MNKKSLSLPEKKKKKKHNLIQSNVLLNVQTFVKLRTFFEAGANK